MPPPTHLSYAFLCLFLNGSLPRTTHNLKAFPGFRLREPPLFSNTFHSPEVAIISSLKIYNCSQLQFFGSTKRDFGFHIFSNASFAPLVLCVAGPPWSQSPPCIFQRPSGVAECRAPVGNCECLGARGGEKAHPLM